MTEAELVAAVLDEAGRLGLMAHHCPDSRRCRGPRGFPDLVVLGRRGVIFAECKSSNGETNWHQDLWIWLLKKTTDVAIWRPADLADGTIKQALENIA